MQKHKFESKRSHAPVHPHSSLPLPFQQPACQEAPSDADCLALWDEFHMYPNIRRHSLLVAHITQCLATRANEAGMGIHVQTARAAALLHDLAKTWCLQHGGAHDTLGASLVLEHTGNYAVAQGVLFHVYWPWAIPDGAAVCAIPMLIQYADKRVMHDRCVTLEERFDDLLVRYGKTAKARSGIRRSLDLGKLLERRLSLQLQRDLHEDTFDSGWLVP